MIPYHQMSLADILQKLREFPNPISRISGVPGSTVYFYEIVSDSFLNHFNAHTADPVNII